MNLIRTRKTSSSSLVELKPPAEQHPLLKMEGGGDNNRPQPIAPVIVTPGWNGHNRKTSWRDHLPEFVSACWMTVILLGISFLAFCALGFGTFKRQQLIVYKYNITQPGSHVYYHQLILDNYVPFVLYENYLSDVAERYPFLQFHVIFLNDDTVCDKRRILFHKFYRANKRSKSKEITEFEEAHPNVNITIVQLSKFMEMTPLKYKWRLIRKISLPFYARLYSVWKNGGIALDLCLYTRDYLKETPLDKRARALLAQHNDGKFGEYADLLKKIDLEEENGFFSFVTNIIQQFMNESKLLCQKFQWQSTLPPDNSSETQPLTRTHRNRRHLMQAEMESNEIINDKSNEVNTTVFLNTQQNASMLYYTIDNTSVNLENAIAPNFNENLTKATNLSEISSNINETDNPGIFSEILLFFELPVASSIQKQTAHYSGDSDKENIEKSLALDQKGSLIAASYPYHKFLDHLLNKPVFLDACPAAAIKNTFSTHCSGLFPSVISLDCDNIYIF